MRGVRSARVGAAAAAALVALMGCGGGSDDSSATDADEVTVVVNAPFSGAPYVARMIANGVQLGIETAGDSDEPGVFSAGEHTYRLRMVKLDSELSPRQALRNVRRAAADGALAVIDEGTGVDASWEVARDADLPVGIVYQGGPGLVDEERRPNVFRIVPRDRGVAFRLAEYLVPKRLKLAILHDDTGYGREGAEALRAAFELNPEAIASAVTVSAGQSDLAPQVLRAKRSGATALLVWARGPTIAAVLTAARSRGWDVPVYTAPAGADPVVRQQLADHPEWVDGLTFASGRMAAEGGPTSFEAFQTLYVEAFGADDVGVRARDGQRVLQPPEYAMYPYDFVHLLVAAVRLAGGAEDRAKVVEALNNVVVEGANGDERSFNRRNHEAVIDDDVYFARFEDMTYRPVQDDPLSATLPVVPQVR
ncbi:MAG: ABC transporter substrate-binding protein [Gaiellaceae bacterium]